MEKYKDIIYEFYSGFSMLELNLNKNGIDSSGQFIEKVSVFVELIGFTKPDFVLFNKSEKDFEITEQLHRFAHKQILDSIFSHGIKKIIFLVTEERYNIYSSAIINRPDIVFFKSFNDIKEYIISIKKKSK